MAIYTMTLFDDVQQRNRQSIVFSLTFSNAYHKGIVRLSRRHCPPITKALSAWDSLTQFSEMVGNI
jgi:hypothetical protein